MNNKNSLIKIILFPFIFTAIQLTSDLTSYNGSQNLQFAEIMAIDIDQVNFNEQDNGDNSPIANVKITYDLPLSEICQYINLEVKSPYPPFENIWIGQNIALNSFENLVELSFLADLSEAGFLFGMDIQEISLSYLVTDEILKEPPVIDESEFILYNVGEIDFSIGNGIILDTEVSMPGILQFLHNWLDILDSTWIYRGCTVPNIDLDNSSHPFFIDNTGNIIYMGDANACATAACANSISWLESQHPEINTGKNARELLELLDGFVNRSLINQAPTMEDLISGTLDFIDSLQLPISVKFQSFGITDQKIDSPNDNYGHSAQNHGIAPNDGTANQVSWDWIKSEMEAGEDVTIVMSNWTGTEWGDSHAVTLTGISKDSNNKKITFKDDSNQLLPGGTSETQIDVNEQNGWLVTNYPSGTGGTQIITAVVSKSYDANVTFIPTAVNTFGNKRVSENIILNNYPNPFNSSTIIHYSLNNPYLVRLLVFDITGSLIKVLEEGEKLQGEYIYVFDAKELSSGVYYVLLNYGNSIAVKKILLLK